MLFRILCGVSRSFAPKQITSRHGKKEPGNTFVLTAIKTCWVLNIFLFGPLQGLPKSTESVYYSDRLNQNQSLYFTDLL